VIEVQLGLFEAKRGYFLYGVTNSAGSRKIGKKLLKCHHSYHSSLAVGVSFISQADFHFCDGDMVARASTLSMLFIVSV
jgi:hypothetical protein